MGLVEVQGQSELAVPLHTIVEVYRSANENMITLAGYPMQPSVASLVSIKGAQGILIFVHFYLLQDEVGVLYQVEEPVTEQNYAQVRGEALAEVEAMGFIMNNTFFHRLSPAEQQKLVAGLPIFGGGKASSSPAKESLQAEGDSKEEDPETILVLEEEAGESGPPEGESAVSIEKGTWEILFRLLASL